MGLNEYVASINKRYKLGNATEHTYRGDLEHLIEAIVPDVSATNEPKRIKCGAPDYVLMRRDIPVGFIEAKDIGDKDLSGTNKKGHKEQFDRYKAALNNLMFTDYLDFHLYIDGEFVTKVAIAEVREGQIVALPENFATFTNLLTDFCVHVSQTITSSKKLAEMMAGKARMLSDVIGKALLSDEESSENSELREQLEAFRQILIHDISPTGFADVYAQTIAYGLFAARLHDPDLPTFSRDEAARLIPKSNPFLRRLFGYIAGANLDDRISWIVDNLVEIFLACNVGELLGVGNIDIKTNDPIIHFYETFLSEYDPKLRKARGVWYTPQPVVSFIVRAVDDILKSDFDLDQGLADTSKTKVTIKQQTSDKRSKSGTKDVEKEVHRVQILDPATGTGTFLAETVRQIYKKFEGQQGIWSSYVEANLIPRLNGFELLMASYAIAHLKLDLLLTETGYKPESDQRFKIYLTNSLEESHPETGTLFASWLSAEANEANAVKRDAPVMCVFGNPPYSGESSNKGEWIMKLMDDYKKEPGGVQKLQEQNSKFVNDDYVKFIRFAQHFVERNGHGVVAYINPHGYLDNPTFRGMRWNLLKTFDEIYTIDLHGNTKKKEKSPDGSVDENVFDIQQGVSINLFVKTGKKAKGELAKVHRCDVYGKRDEKYRFLIENTLDSISFTTIKPFANSYLFKEMNEDELNKYNEGFSPTEMLKSNVMGFQTHRDDFAIALQKDEIESRFNDLLNRSIPDDEIATKYGLKDNRDWKISQARERIQNDADWKSKITRCAYRPFDSRPCYFSKVAMDYPRNELIQNVLNRDNYILGIGKSGQAVGDIEWCLATVTNLPIDANFFRRGGVNAFPIYIYPPNDELTLDGAEGRVPNIDTTTVSIFEKSVGLKFVPESSESNEEFSPLEVLDYIYAVVHSRRYRNENAEFLKVDFPRIPYPVNKEKFWGLVESGASLRKLHTMEFTSDSFATTYPNDGSNAIENVSFNDEKVWINADQYFQGVTQQVWEFHIGGYQPAQKWLADRKGLKLTFEDTQHYRKLIYSLTETLNIMEKLEEHL